MQFTVSKRQDFPIPGFEASGFDQIQIVDLRTQASNRIFNGHLGLTPTHIGSNPARVVDAHCNALRPEIHSEIAAQVDRGGFGGSVYVAPATGRSLEPSRLETIAIFVASPFSSASLRLGSSACTVRKTPVTLT